MTDKQTSPRRALVATAIILTLAQGAYFQLVHEQRGRELSRLNTFDADYRSTIMPKAIAASGSRPIYLQDAPAIPGYIQALWYATLDHVALEKFTILSAGTDPPEGAVVISTNPGCTRCEVLFERSPYRVYIVK
jgi:hypothetical protein